MPVLKLLTLPIGNLGDITTRAKENLASSSWILAEDTRNFKKICDLLNIDFSHKKIESFHEHSDQKVSQIIDRLINGDEDALLVSDAGSPIISDPAFPLVSKAVEKQIRIESIPGVSSIVVALELSGLPPAPFCFHGFLPRDKKSKEELFNHCHLLPYTHLFFESPHRIEGTLDQLSQLAVDFHVVVARELTKKFEDVLRFKASEWKDFKSKLTAKGEIVLILRGVTFDNQGQYSDVLLKLAADVLERKAHPKAVSRLLGEILGRNTKDIYSALTREP